MILSVLRSAAFVILLAASPFGPAFACAFHLFVDLPEAPLSKQMISNTTLIAARPDPDNPFGFLPVRLLRGQATESLPPHLVDTTTRRRLQASPEHAVLFSRDADGIWTRLLYLDESTMPVVETILSQAEHWAAAGGKKARRDFAADLLADPDQRLRNIALRELDSMDYATLRAGHYELGAEQLLKGISNLQMQPYAPIQIQLLGIIGGELAEKEAARRLHGLAASSSAAGLGAWTTAALELNGTSALSALEDTLADRGSPLSKEQADEIVQALAVQSIQGDPVLRGPARMALLQFGTYFSDASHFARAQAVISSVFIGSMESFEPGASGTSALLALLVAFLYGAIHTLGPGHGKAVVISYFVGSGGSLWRGVLMGTQIAVTHVLSAIIVVFVLDFAVRQTTGNAPSDYRLIRLASYAAITTIGAAMLWRGLKSVYEFRRHEHPSHHHHSGCASCAAAAKQSARGAGWLATAVGVVPCTGALMVMLYGSANDAIGPAIAMVVAISLGMAMAITALGVVAIWGHNWAATRWAPDPTQSLRFEIGARLAGSTIVLAIGATLFALTLSTSVVLVGP